MGLSAVLGALGFRAHYKRQERAKRRIPRKWPLAVRSLVNSREKLVWRYLQRAFADHYIMVKAPVTRFTIPQVREESQHWFELLSAVYCTFTVCDAEGQVIGCVDVPGPQGLSLSNQTLKHTLLTQCSLRYWVIDAEQLPSVNSLRVAFLGENAALRDVLSARARPNSTKPAPTSKRHSIVSVSPAPQPTSAIWSTTTVSSAPIGSKTLSWCLWIAAEAI